MKSQALSVIAQNLQSWANKQAFGIYVHVPFCLRRCAYCAFTSTTIKPIPVDAYVNAILREYHARKADFEGFTLETLYLGGGTPSLLPVEAIATIIEALMQAQSTPIEITLEANPEQITTPLMREYKAIGINRLSMGVQSFDPKTLQFLGREHSPAMALRAMDSVHDAGIEDLCVDIIYGSAASSPEVLQRDLDTLQRSPATHLSIYELILEPHTALAAHAKRGMDVKLDEDALLACIDVIRHHAGAFERYEISSYARKGYYSLHNMSTWYGLPYLGLGLGAHSFARSVHGGEYRRWANGQHLRRYLAEPTQTLDFTEGLDADTHLAERLMLGLRTLLPLDLARLYSEVGAPYEGLEEAIERCVRRGWLTRQGDCVQSTEEGLLFHDAMSLALMPG